MNTLQVSAIVCSHNPRADYLQRALDALRSQTLAADRWELLLIDNASTVPLASVVDLGWHPHGRCVREDQLGLTMARLRGIRESGGDLLVFVDDDNVLAHDYLEVALSQAQGHPHIGAFGGSVKGEFETPPPDWIGPYLSGLVVCEIERNYWSNVLEWSPAVPYGAGLCVRRDVATDYAHKAVGDPRRKALGRNGGRLGAGDDTDLAWCAVDLGMGTGRFCALRLTHLIPSVRLTQEYVARLYAGFAGSGLLLRSLRSDGKLRKEHTWIEVTRLGWRLLSASRVERKVMLASRRERGKAWKLLEGEGNAVVVG
jgi:glycosyltransferase involved in cell wall biosynthesis